MSGRGKVIFVAGADFSGTTMLDFILGSVDAAASLGEVAAFVAPTHPRQLGSAICTCRTDCGNWIPRQYPTVNDLYSRVLTDRKSAVAIDSSKNPVWIESAAKRATAQGLDCRFVLIWKSSESYARSCALRGYGRRWYLKWLTYHLAVQSLGHQFKAVFLDDLLNDPAAELVELESYLDIGLHERHFDYGTSSHHAIFGSATARSQMHPAGSVERAAELAFSKRNSANPASSSRPPAFVEARISELIAELRSGTFGGQARKSVWIEAFRVKGFTERALLKARRARAAT